MGLALPGRHGPAPGAPRKRLRDKRALPLAAWEWDRRHATPTVGGGPNCWHRSIALRVRGSRARPPARRAADHAAPPPQIRAHQPMAPCSPSPDRRPRRQRTCGGGPGRAPPPWQNSQMPQSTWQARVNVGGSVDGGKSQIERMETRAFELLRDHTMPAKGEEQSPELAVPAVRLRRPTRGAPAPGTKSRTPLRAPSKRRARLQPAAQTARPLPGKLPAARP